MIADILPTSVSAIERFADIDGIILYPEEEAVIRNAVDKRRQEFATVRQCARDALGTLGLAPVALVPGTRGAPNWPAGVVGSMTHCDGYRAAAVAFDADIAGIGIDAEPDQPLPNGVLELVSRPGERTHLDALAAVASSPCWDRLLFCAKEALYKAWYPLTGRWLDFADAVVTIRTDATFTASVLVPGARVGQRSLTEFAGRWVARSGLLLAAVVVAPPGTARRPSESSPS